MAEVAFGGATQEVGAQALGGALRVGSGPQDQDGENADDADEGGCPSS